MADVGKQAVAGMYCIGFWRMGGVVRVKALGLGLWERWFWV